MASFTVADVKLSVAPGAWHLQRVPRQFFDLIPGQAREVSGRGRTFWVKDMSLSSTAGTNLLLMVYCDEPPEGGGPLLREHQPGIATGVDAPAD